MVARALKEATPTLGDLADRLTDRKREAEGDGGSSVSYDAVRSWSIGRSTPNPQHRALLSEEMDERVLRRSIFSVEGYDDETVAKHLQLMEEDGLVEANLLVLEEYAGAIEGKLMRITAAGHDFLEASRDDTVWRRAVTIVIKQGGPQTIHAIISVLRRLAEERLGLPPSGD